MRPILRTYVAAVGTLAGLIFVHDLGSVPYWPHEWSVTTLVTMTLLCTAAQHLQFQVHRNWYTTAGAVPGLASAFLLPPGLAELAYVIGSLTRVVTARGSVPKGLFNVASAALTIATASHLAASFGGPALLSDPDGLPGLPVAVAAAGAYYAVTVSTVAGAVALESGRSFWQVLRGKVGFKTIAEIGLGLVGATLAVVFCVVPGWAPALVLPGVLVYLAKQAMESADRRSRNLNMTSAVGRAVAGTLRPELAFQAITARAVCDSLKLDGMALLPTSDPPAFEPHVACDVDLPALREAVTRQVAEEPARIEIRGDGRDVHDWLPASIRDQRVGAAAVPFGAGDGGPIGVLVAWRSPQSTKQAAFNGEEVLVLDTLADYAAVALESARLANEMARMYRDAAAAEALREVESLREVARLKDEFLGQVSHELRTPLTIIHGYAELIADGLVRGEGRMRDTAGEVHANSTLMLRLVDDLLDTSRLESGRLSLKYEMADLAPWLERTVGAFALATSTHRVVAELPRTLPIVRADLARLGQVLHNLLTNAARYSPEGSEIRVVAKASGVRDEIEIRVIDRGIGIEAEERERIFEKFYRGKDGATHAVRGTGLGLAVAKMLTEAHLGQISVESKVGQGSTFLVRLPTLGAVTELALAA